MLKFLLKTGVMVAAAGLALEAIKKVEESRTADRNQKPDLPVRPADRPETAQEAEKKEADAASEKKAEPEASSDLEEADKDEAEERAQ